ncbi:MAG: DUF4760 domain-containing protein [Candidatus Eremiobacteraeota bacterium]|nr:DUF4760 domain-containing protein [Candidatus Eremiobacteraeota bacterium]
MPAELWSTVFAGGTFIVIAATAVAALIQLRHLRASNQLNALLTLMRLWQAPELQQQIAYLRNQLQQKIKEPAFLDEFRVGTPSRMEHPELLVADFWEQVGAFMKFDLMDERSWLDVAAPQAIDAWNRLEPIVSALRERIGPASFENFEYAAARATLYMRRHPRGYFPTATPRMASLKAQDERSTTTP